MDDSDLTHDELRQSVARTFTGSGWDEPEMDAYDRYDVEFQKRCP